MWVVGQRQTRLSFAFYFGLSFLLVVSSEGKAHEAYDVSEFTQKVQPVLAKRCFACHGPNEAEGGLRLSSRESVLAELESGARAVVPGMAADSVLLHRIRGEGDGDRMPPEGKPLTEEEVEAIEAWIAAGAPWSEHWAFSKPASTVVPEVHDRSWVKNPIDAFVLAKLEAVNLQPAARADKIALIRRATYDLTGLPPTTQQVDEFLADTREDAYERMIDRLLDTKQYGEKWASHWLDVVRYAETNGYERDSRKELIWKYRDYVIRSLNEDKPYDRFIEEQIAGDELPDGTEDSMIATGYYRLGIWDDEPADRELARYDYLDDILRTTGETFLGLTIGCARCHDHKIDPISQEDYYSMLDFFSNISPHGAGKTNHVAISSMKDREDYESQMNAKQRLESRLTREVKGIEERLIAAVKKMAPDEEFEITELAESDGKVLPDARTAKMPWQYTIGKPKGNWFEIGFDDSKWKTGDGGFGTPGTPGAVIGTNWSSREIWIRRSFRLEAIPSKVTLSIHHDEDAEVYLNGGLVAEFKGYIGDYKEVDITEQVAALTQTGRNTLAIHCKQTGGGQFIDAGIQVDGVDLVSRLIAEYGEEILGDEGLQSYQALRQELAESLSNVPELPVDFAMAVAERGEQATFILGRGLPTMKGKEVSPRFPQVLNPPEPAIDDENSAESSGKRLALAKWMTSPTNPMTSRVMVNRVWQHHFGRGIVRSSSDFGFQGMRPTHPELLDWLSGQFVAEGWSLKRLHKLIMMSNTYQMSSTANARALELDPNNDSLWRYNLRRLTAEEIRDSILMASGKLNLDMFGPSIYPPLSPEVLATASRPNAAWGRSPEDQANRRTVYVHVKRSLRPPMLSNFDAPETDTTCAVRVTTTVPTQALGMLNSQFMNEQARWFSERVRSEVPDSLSDQIVDATRRITGRSPSKEMVTKDLEFIEELQEKEGLAEEEAFRLYALTLLNTNEFVYLD